MNKVYSALLAGFALMMVTQAGAAFAASTIDNALFSRSLHASPYYQTVQGGDRREGMRGRAEGRRSDMRGGAEDRREKMRERFQDLPPEKQEELRARRAELEKELSGLSPEEREARIKEIREEWKEKHAAKREENIKNLEERWENASPEDRKIFCDSVHEKCAEEGGFVCDTAKVRCSE